MENTDELFASPWFTETKEKLSKINCGLGGGRVILGAEPLRVKWYLHVMEKGEESKLFLKEETGEPDGMCTVEGETFEDARILFEAKLTELGV